MSTNVFPDRSSPPEPEALRARLAKAEPLWSNVIRDARELSPQLTEVWHFASPRIGWSLRLVGKGRVLLYLTPGDGDFRVGLVLGTKAIESRQAGLSSAAAKVLAAAPHYAEGHGIRLVIADAAGLSVVRELLAIKIAPGPTSGGRRKRA